MAKVDMLFPVLGTRLPTDHGYALYSALSRILPHLHNGTLLFGLVPITGRYEGRGFLSLNVRDSRLRMRVEANDIPTLLSLTGKVLEIHGHRVRLGTPHVEALEPAPTLLAYAVLFNEDSTDPDSFLTLARKRLDRLGIRGTAEIPQRPGRDGELEPNRHILRIKQRRLVCYSLRISGLEAEGSLKLQETGLGSRRHMGAGVFLPSGGREEET
jgi:CRISPR-associated protein Cas6